MLAIDMTPTIINRTAIFHIALDTGQALRTSVGKFRYGRTYLSEPIIERASLDLRKKRILRDIFSRNGLVQERWQGPMRSTFRRPDLVKRLFFFDPLYALFEDVTPFDVVLVLDLTTVTNPEWHDSHVSRLYHLAFRKITASGAKIASISVSTAKALWANYGVPLNEITIVPLYLRNAFGTGISERRKREKTLLFVGSLETRKNVEGLIKAFNVSNLTNDGFQLVIAGGDGLGAPAIKLLAQRVRGVKLTGYVSDAELRHLYETSWAFVYPSYLEGFGIPILEAASAGLPILTSITGAPCEVAPLGSTLVDPYDTTAVADGLKVMASLSDAEFSLISANNQKHAASFTFKRYLTTISSLLELKEVVPVCGTGG